jgi:hypothetical protein
VALLPHQIDDFVSLTLPNIKRTSWTDLAMEYTEYVFAQIVREKLVIEEGGPHIEFQIKTRNTQNARNSSGLYDVDRLGVDDVMTKGIVPWAAQTTGFVYDIYEDIFQSSRETIIKMLKIREHEAMSGMAELNEENLWSAPTGPVDTRPMGIPFWLQKNTSSLEGDFLGGNPAGFVQGCAGVSSVTLPRWRNWAFGYSQVNTGDLVRKLKRSMVKTAFQAPVPHPETGFGESKYKMYTTYRVTEPLERLAESRNDNLGKDVAKYMNQVTIGGVALQYVPYLEENDSSDPIYGINWKVFRPYSKKGANMRRSAPKQAPNQRNVRQVHIDNFMNFCCLNRRLCFVGSKA